MKETANDTRHTNDELGSEVKLAHAETQGRRGKTGPRNGPAAFLDAMHDNRLPRHPVQRIPRM